TGIIDTSLARSPFWAGSQRRAIDRRVMDLVVLTAVGLSFHSNARTNLRPENGHTPMISAAYAPYGKRSLDDWQLFASEISSSERAGTVGSPAIFSFA